MVIGVGLLIVILAIAAVLLFRAGSGLFGGLFLLVAFGLFCTTPLGDGLPGTISGWFQSVNSHATPVVQQGQGGGQ